MSDNISLCSVEDKVQKVQGGTFIPVGRNVLYGSYMNQQFMDDYDQGSDLNNDDNNVVTDQYQQFLVAEQDFEHENDQEAAYRSEMNKELDLQNDFEEIFDYYDMPEPDVQYSCKEDQKPQDRHNTYQMALSDASTAESDPHQVHFIGNPLPAPSLYSGVKYGQNDNNTTAAKCEVDEELFSHLSIPAENIDNQIHIQITSQPTKTEIQSENNSESMHSDQVEDLEANESIQIDYNDIKLRVKKDEKKSTYCFKIKIETAMKSLIMLNIFDIVFYTFFLVRIFMEINPNQPKMLDLLTSELHEHFPSVVLILMAIFDLTILCLSIKKQCKENNWWIVVALICQLTAHVVVGITNPMKTLMCFTLVVQIFHLYMMKFM